ncbi:NAD(P)H-binding protein [Niallia taxi]
MYSSVTKTIIEIMAELQIERYIGVTGGSLTISNDKKSLINRLGAKLFENFYSDMMIDKKKEWDFLNSNEQIKKWTLIRLPFVTDQEDIGYIKENLTDLPGIKITNGDIGTFIINQIEDSKYIQKAPFISN